MKLLVIGHSVLDFIRSGATERISAGGIHYSISAINKIKASSDDIILISQFDDETFVYFKKEFDKINKDFLLKVDKIPRVYLSTDQENERQEKYENINSNLTIDHSRLNDFDGILINMITGFDVTLNQLKDIRSKYSGLIFIDIHTLSRGLKEDFKREFKLIPDFKDWAECLDIIQVNQTELFTLSIKKSELDIVEEILLLGVKVICVTKGKFGAKVYYKNQNEIASYFIAAKKINNPNVIGCGDIFGASFFYSYIRNKNTMESLINAVKNAELFVENKLL
ncbi:MAG: carbohydrate kinase family protein [Ignavibacterium sp.]|nr:carbohydrate kinase family protein [Ignavibacterium sp.]